MIKTKVRLKYSITLNSSASNKPWEKNTFLFKVLPLRLGV